MGFAKVRVVCGKCRKKLADLHWYRAQDFDFDNVRENGHGDGGRRWHCKCGADWPVSRQNWDAAYEAAGPGGVITLGRSQRPATGDRRS